MATRLSVLLPGRAWQRREKRPEQLLAVEQGRGAGVVQPLRRQAAAASFLRVDPAAVWARILADPAARPAVWAGLLRAASEHPGTV